MPQLSEPLTLAHPDRPTPHERVRPLASRDTTASRHCRPRRTRQERMFWTRAKLIREAPFHGHDDPRPIVNSLVVSNRPLVGLITSAAGGARLSRRLAPRRARYAAMRGPRVVQGALYVPTPLGLTPWRRVGQARLRRP